MRRKSVVYYYDGRSGQACTSLSNATSGEKQSRGSSNIVVLVLPLQYDGLHAHNSPLLVKKAIHTEVRRRGREGKSIGGIDDGTGDVAEVIIIGAL